MASESKTGNGVRKKNTKTRADYNRKWAKENPEQYKARNKRNHEKAKERMKNDPEYAARRREQTRLASLRYYHKKLAPQRMYANLPEEEKRKAQKEVALANLAAAHERNREAAAARKAEKELEARRRAQASMKRKPGRILMHCGWKKADSIYS